MATSIDRLEETLSCKLITPTPEADKIAEAGDKTTDCEAQAEPRSGQVEDSHCEVDQAVSESDRSSICYFNMWKTMVASLRRKHNRGDSLAAGCKEVVFGIRRRCRTNDINSDANFLLQRYGKLLESCPKFPRTDWSRSDFERYHGTTHRERL